MRRLAALLAVLWALANLFTSYFFVSGAFLSKTAAKEGLLAQASLLLGGVLIEAFAIALIWQCVRILRASGTDTT